MICDEREEVGIQVQCPVCGGPLGALGRRKKVSGFYGGVCCLACRAFFKRVIKHQKVEELQCIYGNSCNQDLLKQRRCPKCRFALCLKSGMKPELVLSGKEKANANDSITKSEISSSATDKTSTRDDLESTNAIECDSTQRALPPFAIRDELLKALDENLRKFSEIAAVEFRSCGRNIDLDDKECLIRQNKILYINLIFGQFLTSGGTPQERLNWLEINRNNRESLNCLVQENPMTLATKVLRLFSNDEVMLNAYLGFAQSFKTLKHISPPDCKAMFARMLLYYPGTLELNNRKEVQHHFLDKALNVADDDGYLVPIDDVLELCKTLEAMSALLHHGGIIDNLSYFHGESTVTTPMLEYSQEEELWLMDKKSRMIAAMQSAHVTSDLFTEWGNLLIKGTPLRPDNSWRMHNLWKKRIYEMYMVHTEFQDQSALAQATIVKSASRLYFAFMGVYLDAIPVEQHPEFMFAPEQRNHDPDAMRLISALPKKEKRRFKFTNLCPVVPAEWDQISPKAQQAMRSGDGEFWLFAIMTTCLFNSISFDLTESPEKLRALEKLKKWFAVSLARRYGGDYEKRMNETFQVIRTLASLIPTHYQ